MEAKRDSGRQVDRFLACRVKLIASLRHILLLNPGATLDAVKEMLEYPMRSPACPPTARVAGLRAELLGCDRK